MTRKLVNSIKFQRGARLKLVRESLGFSRKTLCEKYRHYGLSLGTIQSWEEGRWGGLTTKGADKLVKAFREEGLDLTSAWLLDGIGEPPIKLRLIDDLAQEQLQNTVSHEISFFHEIHDNAVDMAVSDESMLPCFQPGDHVAGKWCLANSLHEASGLPCIIQLQSGEMLIRLLEFEHSSQQFHLISTNPIAKNKYPTIKNVAITNAAPILWIRKQGLCIN